MKKSIVILLVGLLSIILENSAQSSTRAGEFSIWVDKNTSYDEISFKVELVSLCWDAVISNPDQHDLTLSYPGSTIITTDNNTWIEWHACWSNRSVAGIPRFGLGKYKITAKINGFQTDYFWLDWRNSFLPEHFNDVIGSGDIGVYFNANNGKFYWDSHLDNKINSASKTWGEVNGYSTGTSLLEPHPPDNFMLTTENKHPKLTWRMSSEADYWTGYTIYRSTTGTSYSKVATIANKLAASWIDYSFSSGSMLTVYYKMVADNGERKSNFTSIQSINVVPSKKSSESKKIEFILEQNYPNPFNPITVITYSIPSDEFVQLKVYDLIGKEVTELVSQHLKAGVHSVIYDASNQSAGIYIYSIKAGNYTQSKKLIFMK